MSIKTLFIMSFISLAICADSVLLQTGKRVQGTILSYSDVDGLIMDSEYGEITIKPSNLASFVIDTKREMIEEDVMTYETSTLKNEHKVSFDFSLIEADTIIFDGELAGVTAPLIVSNTSKGTFLLFGVEDIGMSNEDYFNLFYKHTKKKFLYSRSSKRDSTEINGIEMIYQDLSGEINGYDMTFRVYTFAKSSKNYRIVFWGLSQIFDNVVKDFTPFIESLKI